MPKRRSLVGTAREAIGNTPAADKSSVHQVRTGARRAHKTAAQPSLSPAPPRAGAPLESGGTEAAVAVMPYQAMAQFARIALEQNLKTSARLARCTSPMEVAATQAAHAAALTQSFIATSLRLMQLSLSAGWPLLWSPEPRRHAR